MRRVVSLSFDDDLHDELVARAAEQKLSLSQFVRNLYQNSTVSTDAGSRVKIGDMLERAALEDSVKLVALHIVNCGKEVLIVRRNGDDVDVPKLSWAFPGGTIDSMHLLREAKDILYRHSGVKSAHISILATRLVPDTSTNAHGNIIAIYFASEVSSKDVKLSAKYSGHAWVKPQEIYSYFTTSVCDDVTAYLNSL